ncbi:MAG: redoxin domain-containing protein, partial [Candidatus Thorarchaeota archaeon]
MDNGIKDGFHCLETGDVAPDFVLPGSNDEDIHLLELLDKNVVLVFFTDTFTMYSTVQAEFFHRLHESMSNLGVVFIGISTEPMSTLKTFIEEQNIPFVMASDFDRNVSKTYGVYAEEVGSLRCVAKPSVVIVDTDGKIDYFWIGELGGNLPKVDEIADRIIKS